MKKKQLGILLMMLCMIGVSSATSILWCSGKSDTDYGWVDLLKGAGYTVDRLEQATVMTQAKVDLANTYDLVIVGRDTISGDYANTGEAALWNSITSPLICQTGYLWQNSRWKWLNSASTFNTGGNIVPELAAGDLLYDILFNGAALDKNGLFNYAVSNVTVAQTASAGNGILIGHRNYDPQPWVYAAYWPQGVEFYDGAAQYAGGPRLALAGGETPDANRGALNLTSDGTIIFLNAVSYMTGNVPAHAPSPAHAATGVHPEVVLTWKAGLDPNDLTKVNPAIKKHYVWRSNGNPANPDLTHVATIDITNYDDPAADGIYDPTPDLITDGIYYWKVEEGLDNGAGGTYPAGDPNNRVSPVWTFDTSTLPEITAQPASVKIDAGQTAVFSMGYSSISSASVTWYKDGSPLTAGGDITIETDTDSSILTLANTDSSDEADYYAIVTNTGGSADPTLTAYLRLKKRLAWYQFEQNLNDSAGTNHATDMGNVAYAAGKVASDGQAYAADPNGSNYGLLSTDAYPKTGFGNGLDTFTYECWVKLAAGEGGVILGTFNDGTTTGFRFSVNGAENNISAHVRQEGGQFVQPGTDSLATDSQWHHIALTYDGSAMKIFVDGSWKTTATGTVTNFAAWQYPIALLARNSRGTILEGFTGQVDDLQIFNYALTTEQVAQAWLGVQGGWICNTELPSLTYDYDNNCQVDIADFAIFAADWLESNRIYAQ